MFQLKCLSDRQTLYEPCSIHFFLTSECLYVRKGRLHLSETFMQQSCNFCCISTSYSNFFFIPDATTSATHRPSKSVHCYLHFVPLSGRLFTPHSSVDVQNSYKPFCPTTLSNNMACLKHTMAFVFWLYNDQRRASQRQEQGRL